MTLNERIVLRRSVGCPEIDLLDIPNGNEKHPVIIQSFKIKKYMAKCTYFRGKGVGNVRTSQLHTEFLSLRLEELEWN